MSTFVDVTMTVHFLGLAMGGAAAFGLPVLGMKAEAAAPEQRPAIGSAIGTVKKIGQAGFGLLILTGLIMATVEGVWSDAPATFWIKLVVVVALFASIVASDRIGPKALAGDAEAGERIKLLGKTNIVLLALILLLASLSFH